MKVLRRATISLCGIFFLDRLFYPGVYYENVLLSPPQWVLPAGVLAACRSGRSDGLAALQSWAEGQHLPVLLSYGAADRRLLWVRGEEQSTLLFLAFCSRARGEVVLEKSFLDQDAPVHDGLGRPYHAEFLAFLINQQRLYRPGSAGRYPLWDEGRQFGLLEDWIFLKVYGRPEFLEAFLAEEFAGWLAEVEQLLSGFYFVRYEDLGGTHLRIRLRGEAGRQQDLLLGLQSWMRRVKGLSGILEISIHPYQREWERYHQVGLERAELLFGISSSLVLERLRRGALEAEERQAEALAFLVALHQQVPLKIPQALWTLSKEQRGRLDGEFRRLKFRLARPLSEAYQALLAELQGSLKGLDAQLAEEFFRDFFHLHCNRLFCRDQNGQELACYYFLHKRLGLPFLF